MKRAVSLFCLISLFLFALAGCSSGGSTVFAEASENISPMFVDETGETVYPIGNTVAINNWDITFTKASAGNEIWASNRKYYPADDHTFIFYYFTVTNNSSEDRVILSGVPFNGMTARMYVMDDPDIKFSAENISDVPTNAYHQTIKAGETKSIAFTFHVPNEIAKQDLIWRMAIEKKEIGGDGEKVVFSFE